MRNHGKWARRRAPAAIALAAVVILIVLLGSSTALAAPPWSDAPNSWWMSTYGITEPGLWSVGYRTVFSGRGRLSPGTSLRDDGRRFF